MAGELHILRKVRNWLSWAVALFCALICYSFVYDYWNHRAVTTQVQYVFTPAEDKTRLDMDWYNRGGCAFVQLKAYQGIEEFPETPKEQVRLDFGPPEGARGEGHQATGVNGWYLERPENIWGDTFYLIVLHRCSSASVFTTMIETNIEEVFPSG